MRVDSEYVSGKGTPKLDSPCHSCEGWGTIIVTGDQGRDEVVPCPEHAQPADVVDDATSASETHAIGDDRGPDDSETGMVSHWLLQCNGADPGALVNRAEAERHAARLDATGDIETGLAWSADSHGARRNFTLTPMDDVQAQSWVIEQRRARNLST